MAKTKIENKYQVLEHNDKVFYALQGGGALGAYQVGILEGLENAGYQPDWVVGTSIGSINAAIVAGNAPEDRIAKLHGFWDRVTNRDFCFDNPMLSGYMRRVYNFWSAYHTYLFGQPGFFKPRCKSPKLMIDSGADELSFYDFAELRETLLEFVDFDRINSGQVRLSVGTVQVDSGKQVYFDTSDTVMPVGYDLELRPCKFGPEHIMASCALPPAFPAVNIDGELFWDGGVSCNTPMAITLGAHQTENTLCFMVNLFDSYGTNPRTYDDILKRHTDICYSSNHRSYVQMQQTIHNLRHAIYELYEKLPGHLKNDPDIKDISQSARQATTHIVRLHYRGDPNQWSTKGAEFSHLSVQDHMQTGLKDMNDALKKSPWLEKIPPHVGIVIHEMTKDPKLRAFLGSGQGTL